MVHVADLDLSVGDIGGLSSPDAVGGSFTRLGYPAGCRKELPAASLDLTATPPKQTLCATMLRGTPSGHRIDFVTVAGVAGWMAEAHSRVIAYVKNHNLGLEVPYKYGSESRRYRPDFIVLVDDGHGDDDLLHLVVEIKGYRREDAKEKKATMETCWVPGVNNLKTYGRWSFAEFCDVYAMEADFEAKVESEFNKMIDAATAPRKEATI